MRRFFVRLWLSVRYWFKAHTASDSRSIRRLMRRHINCCKPAADWALAHGDWRDGMFANWILPQAYLESERLGCDLYGWQRDMMVELFMMQKLGHKTPDGRIRKPRNGSR